MSFMNAELDYENGIPIAYIGSESDRRVYYQEDHLTHTYAVIYDGDTSWGLIHTSLLALHKGYIKRTMCAQTTPYANVPTRTYGYANLYRDGVFDTTLIPEKEINLDEAQALIHQRMGGTFDSCPKRDMMSYVLLLYAVAMRGTEAYLPDNERICNEFVRSEVLSTETSLTWVGDQRRLMLDYNAVQNSDDIEDGISIAFEFAISILPDHGVILRKGNVTALDAAWMPLLMTNVRATHHSNLIYARKMIDNWGDSIHAGLRSILEETGRKLSVRSQKYRPKRKIFATSADLPSTASVRNIQSLYEAMPNCMRHLHERATTDTLVDSNQRLRYNQRTPYFMFMLGSGIAEESLLDIQEHAQMARLGATEGTHYIKKLKNEITGIKKWLTNAAKGNDGRSGHGCAKLYRDGLCGHANDDGVTTLKLAQRRCQLYRSYVLKEIETVPPTGTPIGFALNMHAELETRKRRKVRLWEQ